MAGWFSGLSPRSISIGQMNLNRMSEMQSPMLKPSTAQSAGNPFFQSLGGSSASHLAVTNSIPGEIRPQPVNFLAHTGQGDLGVQLQQMFSTLTAMLQGLPNAQSLMTYSSPSPGAAPGAFGVMPGGASPQSAAPPIMVGGVGIPMANGRLGAQSLMAIDLGIHNAVSDIHTSLASVHL